MKTSKLIQLFSKISIEELPNLTKFINSPFFNCNKDVKKLYEVLKKQHPLFIEKKVNYELVCYKVFKHNKIQKLRYAMTDLTKLIEKYITYKVFEEDKQNYSSCLLKALDNRNINRQFELSIQKILTELKSSPIKDADFYYNQSILNEISFNHTLKTQNRSIDSELQNLVDNIDINFLSKKLKYSCEVINRMNILNIKYDINFLNHTLDYLSNNKFEAVPSINIYYKILLTLKESSNKNHYINAKQQIKKHIRCFKKEEQNDLYGYLQNYCIKKINAGEIDYLNELFSNYEDMLNHKIIIKNNKIAQFDFKNIVTVALRLNKHQWTENFINTYKGYLDDLAKENAVQYNMARVHFFTKRYKLCLRHLLSVEFTDVYYHLDSKALLLKTYYEIDDTESCLSLINTFKTYIKRNKQISDFQKTTYNNFIKYIAYFVQLKLGKKIDLQKIEKELNQTQIADKGWINEKLMHLS